ncbi:hypothetical protein EVAR_62793_1 [Eumeta japonica]|uniref:Uncharacterized protein n=1 Tax=Eumeta variegata TaxID=151549 RepID=A0A4C1ZGL2_EUMVA|nr:hypothetical protein EVAR_62793_1 [Eumeta japonica]
MAARRVKLIHLRRQPHNLQAASFCACSGDEIKLNKLQSAISPDPPPHNAAIRHAASARGRRKNTPQMCRQIYCETTRNVLIRTAAEGPITPTTEEFTAHFVPRRARRGPERRHRSVARPAPAASVNDVTSIPLNVRLCAAALSLLLRHNGRWSGRGTARSALSLARSAQAERDNESCFFCARRIVAAGVGKSETERRWADKAKRRTGNRSRAAPIGRVPT